MGEAKFPMGQTVVTPGALAAVEEIFGETLGLLGLLARHASGDWGRVCPEDPKANERALADGGRILSAYTLEGVRLWIITEADLLPSAYCPLPGVRCRFSVATKIFGECPVLKS